MIENNDALLNYVLKYHRRGTRSGGERGAADSGGNCASGKGRWTVWGEALCHGSGDEGSVRHQLEQHHPHQQARR